MIGLWPANNAPRDAIYGTQTTASSNVTYAPGVSGSTFVLNGTDSYLSISNSNGLFDFRENQSFSFDAWFKTSDSGRLQSIVAKETGYLPTYNALIVPDNRLTCAVQPNEGGTYTAYSKRTYTDGVFHHVMCVVDRESDVLSMIIDGGREVVQVAFPANSTFVSTAENVLIGARISNAPDRFFKGEIDDVGIFNRAITVSEAVDIYRSGENGKCPGQCQRVKNMIGLWKADSSMGDSVAGNHGIAHGQVGYGAGVIDGAFSFDGVGAYVEVPNTNSVFDFGESNDFSFDGWFKTVDSGRYQSIVAKETGFYPTYNALLLPDGRITCGFQPNQGGAYTAYSAAQYNDGLFHHVACVVDRSAHTATLVIDGGVEVVPISIPSGSTFRYPTNNLLIGARTPQSPDRFFKGEIDDVAIYAEALSLQTINSIYQNRLSKCR